jgi:hypothetical protein
MQTRPNGHAPALAKNNITTDPLKDVKKEAVNVVNFLRETGSIYQI